MISRRTAGIRIRIRRGCSPGSTNRSSDRIPTDRISTMNSNEREKTHSTSKHLHAHITARKSAMLASTMSGDSLVRSNDRISDLPPIPISESQNALGGIDLSHRHVEVESIGRRRSTILEIESELLEQSASLLLVVNSVVRPVENRQSSILGMWRARDEGLTS